MKALLPILALSATVLSTPIPDARHPNGLAVKYTGNYPNPPAAGMGDDDLPSGTTENLDEILSIPRPLPSSFLLNVPSLREQKSSTPRPEGREWDMRHVCPIAALLAVSVLGLLACAVQRYVVFPNH